MTVHTRFKTFNWRGEEKLGSILLIALLLKAQTIWASPVVVTFIKPIHSLIAGVMEGVGEPVFPFQGSESPHDHTLRPSEVKLIYGADLLVWVGPTLEGFLIKPLENKDVKAQILTLQSLEGVEWIRTGESIHEENSVEENDHHHQQGQINPHIWLDPQIAQKIVFKITEILIHMDSIHRDLYKKNSAIVLNKLKILETELTKELLPVKNISFMTFHDAYSYFQKRFNLNGIGSVTLDPERMPGARRVSELKRKIIKSQAVCVFSEPQFQSKLVKTLIEGTETVSGILDPLGADFQPGGEAYFLMMYRLKDNLKDCLLRK